MSSSMPIPTRSSAQTNSGSSSNNSPSTPSSSFSYSASPSSLNSPMSSASTWKGKSKVSIPTSTTSSSPSERISPRRPSLLSSSLAKSEYTVINLAREDGPPRLISCVKRSQGFDWNQELFLPSYLDYEHGDLEHRPDPVEEIVLTEEECRDLLPQ